MLRSIQGMRLKARGEEAFSRMFFLVLRDGRKRPPQEEEKPLTQLLANP